MAEKSEIKVTRTYSLDPDVIAWVTRKAARMTMETSERVSDSQVVNDILKAAIEEDNEIQASIPPAKPEKKPAGRKQAQAIAA